MYQPSHFVERRADVLHALIAARPLGTLVRLDAAGTLQADAIPLIAEPGDGPLGVLRGHVARANPLWRDAGPAGVPALVVFHGPQGYVSPSWYPSKAAHGKVVPTWNYVVVQARGTLRAVDDTAWLRAFVGRLTDRMESGRAAAWSVDDAPADYTATMLRAIVGIEIELTSLEGKFKLSQNRDAADLDGVVAGLRHDGATALADAVLQGARGDAPSQMAGATNTRAADADQGRRATPG